MKTIHALTAILVLNGCSSVSVDDSPLPTPDQSVGGIWRGQATGASGTTLDTVILASEDGRYFSIAENVNSNCADVAQGALTAAGATLTGYGNFGQINFMNVPAAQMDCAFNDGSVWGTSVVSGSVVQRASLTLTSADTTSAGTALPSNTATLMFDTLYNESSDLSKTTGNWSTQTGATFDIDPDGIIASQDPNTGCVQNGQLSVIDPAYDMYSVTVTYSDCQSTVAALNGVTALGLIALDDKVVPNVLYIGYAMTIPGGNAFMVATKATR
jgi:hypothetical protein